MYDHFGQIENAKFAETAEYAEFFNYPNITQERLSYSLRIRKLSETPSKMHYVVLFS